MPTSRYKPASWSLTLTRDERLMLHMVSDYYRQSAAEFVRYVVRAAFEKIPADDRAALLERAEGMGHK